MLIILAKKRMMEHDFIREAMDLRFVEKIVEEYY